MEHTVALAKCAMAASICSGIPSPPPPLGHSPRDGRKREAHEQLPLSTPASLPAPPPALPSWANTADPSVSRHWPVWMLQGNRIVGRTVFVSGFQGSSPCNTCRSTVFMARRPSISRTRDIHRLRDVHVVSTWGLSGKTLLSAPVCGVPCGHDSVALGDTRRGTIGWDGTSARPPRNSPSWSVQLP